MEGRGSDTEMERWWSFLGTHLLLAAVPSPPGSGGERVLWCEQVEKGRDWGTKCYRTYSSRIPLLNLTNFVWHLLYAVHMSVCVSTISV